MDINEWKPLIQQVLVGFGIFSGIILVCFLIVFFLAIWNFIKVSRRIDDDRNNFFGRGRK